MSILKVSKIQHINSSGDGFVFDEKGTVGIGTSVMDTNVIGAASSAVGPVSYTHLTLPTKVTV